MVKEGDFVYDSPEWVLHNGIGYVFPAGGNLFLSKKIQTGSWYSINHTESKNEQQQEVFTLGFNHGCNPRNATYAYIVVPGIHSARKMNHYRKSPVEILANTDSMQIVRHTKLGIWQMVFYKESTFRNGELSVSVDKACALMIKDGHSGNAELHIADPGQTQSCIKVELLIPEISSERKTVLCDFRNTGIYAGASKAYKLKNIL